MKKILLMLILAALCVGAVFAEWDKTPYIDYPSRTLYFDLDSSYRRIVVEPKEKKIYLYSRDDNERYVRNISCSMMDEDGKVYEFSFEYNGNVERYGYKFYSFLLVNNYEEVLNLLSEKNELNVVFKNGKSKFGRSMSCNKDWLTHCIHWVLTAEYFRGDKGPAGGTILYDCGADDDIGNADGMLAYEKGWRYIEFVNKYIHLIGKKPSCDDGNDFYSSAKAEFQFLPEMDDSLSTSASILVGKENTDKILEAFKAMASKNNQNYPINSCAAKLCDELEYNGFDDWYLPSFYEVYNVYKLLGFDALPDDGHDSYGIWTSTREDGKLYFFANTCYNGRLSSDRQIAQDVSTMNRILPFRRF